MQQPRTASAAIIGAGDYIGAAIARRFAADGYTIFAGRRNGEKLAPLVTEIEAAGGCCIGHALDARKEDDVTGLAQSMARELGPRNIHVAHLVIDSGVDTEWARQRRREAGKSLEPGVLMNPSSVAETYWLLHQQPRGAWTHELDLRPNGDAW